LSIFTTPNVDDIKTTHHCKYNTNSSFRSDCMYNEIIQLRVYNHLLSASQYLSLFFSRLWLAVNIEALGRYSCIFDHITLLLRKRNDTHNTLEDYWTFIIILLFVKSKITVCAVCTVHGSSIRRLIYYII